jgi:hypothetical protein
MKSIFQDIQSEVQGFIDSRTESLLIVPCEPAHSALLLKSLEAVEDEPKSFDIFLSFGHKFSDPASYVREIPPVISRQFVGVNQELAKRGEPALPPLDIRIPHRFLKRLHLMKSVTSFSLETGISSYFIHSRPKWGEPIRRVR